MIADVKTKKMYQSLMLCKKKVTPDLVTQNNNKHLLSCTVAVCQESGDGLAVWFQLRVYHKVALKMSSRTAVISRLKLEHPLPRGLTHMPGKLVLALVGGLSSSAHSNLHKQHLCSHHMVAHFLQNKLSKRLKRQLRCLL